ncbi:MAG: hypothetical protein OEV81_15980 [Betaproteobacteria bacterium]|nr:hypothetical protein [Betaproteobacteria bacterium]MDH5219756.1 hypothetical protein [Betaproteobacteria bacterium]MDH5350503.1 hypothetical protein [Betaproteobacteria bacterium]
MSRTRDKSQLVVAVALAALVVAGAPPARAQQEPRAKPPAGAADPVQVERRLQSVGALVETSSAARQIETSGDAEAIALRNKARQVLRHAQEAHAAGDFRSAQSLLDDAARQLFEGARLAVGERAKGDSLGKEVATRIGAARALLAAQKRISAEQSAARGAQAAQRVETLLADAQALADAQRFEEARPLADQAYLLAKASIGSMRQGATLVRTLSFASKEEEYHYELDRNDTHRMLLDLLAKQAAEPGPAQGWLARAAELRREAEERARRGDYGAAVGLLEDSTRELVRAIRSSGVFIPG